MKTETTLEHLNCIQKNSMCFHVDCQTPVAQTEMLAKMLFQSTVRVFRGQGQQGLSAASVETQDSSSQRSGCHGKFIIVDEVI